MKTVIVNISLSRELADFARSDSEAHAFGSMSEYMRDLIRRRRQERIKEDVAFLEKSIAGAPMGDPSEKEMADILKKQRCIRTEFEIARHKRRHKQR